MDFDYVPATPGGSRWVGESAARRRLSSPSLRTYVTPAFDAVAAGDGGVSGYSSSSSSGGLDLGFDASLLRYRRACFAVSADLDSRVLLYSPQSAPPPPPPQVRTAYPAADDGVWAAGGGRYNSKREMDMLDRLAGLLLRQVSRNSAMAFLSSLRVRQLLIILLQQLKPPPTPSSCLPTSDHQKMLSSQQPTRSFRRQSLRPRRQLNL